MAQSTTYAEFKKHLNDKCGITLETHLTFNNTKSVKDYALATTILVLYRYAEKMGKKIEIRDAIASGHKSHKTLLTETDFDLDGNGAADKRDPLIQLKLIRDLLLIGDNAKDSLSAYRLGFYFDEFKDAKKELLKKKGGDLKTDPETYERFKELYEGKSAAASLHLGARYLWEAEQYKGKAIKEGTTFGMWGRGSTHGGTGDYWPNKIKDWDQGYLQTADVDAVVKSFVADCKKLNSDPPPKEKRRPSKTGGARRNAGTPRKTQGRNRDRSPQ